MENDQEPSLGIEVGHHGLANGANAELAGQNSTNREANKHLIHFKVDGEPFETSQSHWTADQIITTFSQKDLSNHYLVRIVGHEKESFQGHGDQEIKLREKDRFQTICTGPTTVSDGTARTGVENFVTGLTELGFLPEQVPGFPDHVMFDYNVETGKYSGKGVRLGFVVPPDFPLTPPTGPHVSPTIHANVGGGVHPLGGVHDSPNFQSATGNSWQYWSRPHSNWKKRTIAEYMSHIWLLWDTQ